MAISCEYHPELGIVEAKNIGQVSEDELKMVTSQAFDLGKVNNSILFLVNSSELDEIPLIDLYFLPNLYNELGFDRRSKIAHLLPKNIDAAENAQFYEDVLINRGWQVKSFTDREEAIIWLTNK